MKKNSHLISRLITIAFVFSGMLISCADNLLIDEEDVYNYTAPDYPKKSPGHYLSYISYEMPDISKLTSGKKVEFVYNEKNAVDHILIYGSDSDRSPRRIGIEYNEKGLAWRYKYFDLDSVITHLEEFEYDVNDRLILMSHYQKDTTEPAFRLRDYKEYTYPSADTIIELSFSYYYDFNKSFKTIFLLDENGNVEYQIYPGFENSRSYPGTRYFYSNKMKPFEGQGLPKYEISYNNFQMAEVFSVNHLIGDQNCGFRTDSAIKYYDEPQMQEYLYDEEGYPIQLGEPGNGRFYHYIDLE